MKKLSFAILAFFLAIGILAPTNISASNSNNIIVIINDDIVDFLDQQPVVIDGRTFIPTQYLLEYLDIDVYALDAFAQTIYGSAMLPLRTIAEGLGYQVDWDSHTDTVTISAPMDSINRDGILHYMGSSWAGIFNPILSNNAHDAMVNTLVFEGLISNNAAGEPIPLLATHWEFSNGYRTITFSIDPRAAFSDGKPLTAHDVAFTFYTIADPLYDGPRFSHVQNIVGAAEFRAGQAGSIEGIHIIDDHTIEFTHIAASPQHIWNFGMGILCADYYAWDSWDDFVALNRAPFGSGQYEFIRHIHRDRIELIRNENYWNPDRSINLAGIVLNYMQYGAIFSVLDDNAHLGQAWAGPDSYEMLAAAPNAHGVLYAANTMRHVTFNTTSPQLADHRVRQALAYAFDTHAYLLEITGGEGFRTVGTAPFAPVSWAFPHDAGLNEYEFNMQRAAQLMEEAGWTMGPDGVRVNADGVRMSLLWLIFHEVAWPTIITNMALQTWGELGVELDIQMMDFSMVSDLTTGMPPGEKMFDVFQMGWQMSIDPDLRGGLWDGSDANNVAGTFFNSGFRYDRLIELIELGATTMDQNERAAIYHEIAQLTNYYLPVWVLSYGMNMWAVHNSVQNLEISAFMSPMTAITQQGTWIAD